MAGIGTIIEQPADGTDDRAELVMVQGPDEDAARVVATCLGPLAKQRGEVAGVPGDEDACFGGGELEHERVVERTEPGVGGKAEHVVAPLFEGRADPFRGQVGVEEQTQRSGPDDLDEREEHRDVGHWAPIVSDRLVDLLGVRVAVRLGQPNLCA